MYFNETQTNSKHSLRLPSWRIMFARLMLVTHSSSLRMLEGMVWRHTCRGSIFLVTRGMVGFCGQGDPTLKGKEGKVSHSSQGHKHQQRGQKTALRYITIYILLGFQLQSKKIVNNHFDKMIDHLKEFM